MLIELNENEARALGALMEKSLTTPEQYPLSFNALLNACNQKTSRDPVMTLDVDALGDAVSSLIAKDLIERRTGSRVPKFAHRIENLVGGSDPRIVGTVCVLLLRGPQTPGEIKARTDRMCDFAATAEVEALLHDLATHADGPYVARLPRKPGQKETRYRHLFSGGAADAVPAQTPASGAAKDRLGELEERVADLEAACRALANRLDKLAQP